MILGLNNQCTEVTVDKRMLTVLRNIPNPVSLKGELKQP